MGSRDHDHRQQQQHGRPAGHAQDRRGQGADPRAGQRSQRQSQRHRSSTSTPSTPAASSATCWAPASSSANRSTRCLTGWPPMDPTPAAPCNALEALLQAAQQSVRRPGLGLHRRRRCARQQRRLCAAAAQQSIGARFRRPAGRLQHCAHSAEQRDRPGEELPGLGRGRFAAGRHRALSAYGHRHRRPVPLRRARSTGQRRGYPARPGQPQRRRRPLERLRQQYATPTAGIG